MRKSTLSATFVALLLAFFVCGCEEEKSDTENYDKNISTKVISKNSKKKSVPSTNLFQSASDFLALIDSSDEIQALQNPRYKKKKKYKSRWTSRKRKNSPNAFPQSKEMNIQSKHLSREEHHPISVNLFSRKKGAFSPK